MTNKGFVPTLMYPINVRSTWHFITLSKISNCYKVEYLRYKLNFIIIGGFSEKTYLRVKNISSRYPYVNNKNILINNTILLRVVFSENPAIVHIILKYKNSLHIISLLVIVKKVLGNCKFGAKT